MIGGGDADGWIRMPMLILDDCRIFRLKPPQNIHANNISKKPMAPIKKPRACSCMNPSRCFNPAASNSKALICQVCMVAPLCGDELCCWLNAIAFGRQFPLPLVFADRWQFNLGFA